MAFEIHEFGKDFWEYFQELKEKDRPKSYDELFALRDKFYQELDKNSSKKNGKKNG